MGRMEGGRRTTATLPLPVLLLAVVVVGVSLQGRRCIAQAAGGGGLTRGSFPKGFVFGTAAAAYQVRRGGLVPLARYLLPPSSYSVDSKIAMVSISRIMAVTILCLILQAFFIYNNNGLINAF